MSVAHLLIFTGLGCVLAVSLRLIVLVGNLSFAHGAFMAVGAYTTALLSLRTDLSSWFIVFMSGILAAAVAVVVGMLSLRLRGAYFAILTFVLAEFVRLIVVNVPALGGFSGLMGFKPDSIIIPGLRTVDFTSTSSFYYLALLLLVVTVLFFAILDRSRFGAVCKAIGHNDTLCAATGINVSAHKVAAFAIACFFAGLAGSLHAYYFRFTTSEFFTIWTGAYAVVHLVVGGMGSITGPIVGCTVLTLVQEAAHFSIQFQHLIYALVLVVVVMFLPEGIIMLPTALRTWIRRIAGKENLAYHGTT